MYTFISHFKNINKWFIVDATNKVLGRLSSKIILYLIGKDSLTYTPYHNINNNIIIINIEKIKFTGKKIYKKIYYKHTGYIGNLKKIYLYEKFNKDARKVLFLSIKNMLPKNKLLYKRLKQIKLFIGNKHPYLNYNLNKINI